MGGERWPKKMNSAFGGWAQSSPPLAVWAFPIETRVGISNPGPGRKSTAFRGRGWARPRRR